MQSKHNILSPYFSMYSMTRSGMTTDPQQGHGVYLTTNWERPNYQCDSQFIQADFFSSEKSDAHAEKLNAEMIPVLDEIVDIYIKQYTNKNLELNHELRVIVRRDEDGLLGWSFDKRYKKDGEWLTRGDTVTLADGKTSATVLFVFDNAQLSAKLSRLGR